MSPLHSDMFVSIDTSKKISFPNRKPVTAQCLIRKRWPLTSSALQLIDKEICFIYIVKQISDEHNY